MLNFLTSFKVLLVCLISIASVLLCRPSFAALKTAEEKAEQIWVGKSDEATSCNPKSGVTLDAMTMELTKAGVKVLKKKKIHDSHPRIAMCGTDKGTMNGYLVSKKDLEKVQSLGFKDMSQ